MADVDRNVLDQAHTCRVDGNYDDARPLYEQMLACCPEEAECWWGMGLTIMNQGEFDEAIECLKKAAELAPESQRYILDLAKHYAMLGMDEEAKAAFERVVEMDPNSREGAEAGTQLSYY